MRKLSLILFVGLIMTFPVMGQMLDARVTMQYAHLSSDEQKELENLGNKVEQYFNNYQWIEDEYEYDVECNVQIIIETVQQKTFEKVYKAQFLISSTSGENPVSFISRVSISNLIRYFCEKIRPCVFRRKERKKAGIRGYLSSGSSMSASASTLFSAKRLILKYWTSGMNFGQ